MRNMKMYSVWHSTERQVQSSKVTTFKLSKLTLVLSHSHTHTYPLVKPSDNRRDLQDREKKDWALDVNGRAKI